MADPAIVACAADGWTKVATSVLSARLYLLTWTGARVYHTYRATGAAAPTALTDAADFPSKAPERGYPYADQVHRYADHDHGELVDLYIWPASVGVSVRADTPVGAAGSPTVGIADAIHATGALSNASYPATVYLPSATGVLMEGYDDLLVLCGIDPSAATAITISLERQLSSGGAWVAADTLTVHTPSGVPGAVGGWSIAGGGTLTPFMIDAENLNCFAYRIAVGLEAISGVGSYITGRRERRRG